MKSVWSRMSRSVTRSIFPVSSARGFQESDHLQPESVVSFKSDVGRLQRISISNGHGSSEVIFTLSSEDHCEKQFVVEIPCLRADPVKHIITSMAPSTEHQTGSDADH